MATWLSTAAIRLERLGFPTSSSAVALLNQGFTADINVNAHSIPAKTHAHTNAHIHTFLYSFTSPQFTMLFGQLVCYGCHRILTYPLGAITCRCRLCNTVNAAQNLQIACETCGQELHAPINTLALLCPCCGTVTDIPEDLLPPLPSYVDLGGAADEMETAIYVSHPTLPPRQTPASEPGEQASAPAAAAAATAAAAALARRASGSARAAVAARPSSGARAGGRLGPSSREEREAAAAVEANHGVGMTSPTDTNFTRAGGRRSGSPAGTAQTVAAPAGRSRETSPPANAVLNLQTTELEEPRPQTASQTSRNARAVAASRLAPTVMIATRIL